MALKGCDSSFEIRPGIISGQVMREQTMTKKRKVNYSVKLDIPDFVDCELNNFRREKSQVLNNYILTNKSLVCFQFNVFIVCDSCLDVASSKFDKN